mmetsp:Transcript_22292/g.55094  ORF Transcript_22292/g.55094 Transcript_22292/m.55094 type:complete len:207 (+) Transcript_22292:2525-3145(+)
MPSGVGQQRPYLFSWTQVSWAKHICGGKDNESLVVGALVAFVVGDTVGINVPAVGAAVVGELVVGGLVVGATVGGGVGVRVGVGGGVVGKSVGRLSQQPSQIPLTLLVGQQFPCRPSETHASCAKQDCGGGMGVGDIVGLPVDAVGSLVGLGVGDLVGRSVGEATGADVVGASVGAFSQQPKNTPSLVGQQSPPIPEHIECALQDS